MEVARRSDFPGEGLWRRLGLTLHRNVTPALREVCAGCRQRDVSMRARNFPSSWGRFTPQPRQQLPVSAPLGSRREVTYRCLSGANVASFKQPQNRFFK